MAIQTQWADPTDTGTLETAYVRVASFTLDDLNKTATVNVAVYRSAAARLANKNPLTIVAFAVGPNPQPERAAVTLPNGTVVQPATPAIPSYDEVEAMFNAADAASPRDKIKNVIYELLKQLPEFSGGVDV